MLSSQTTGFGVSKVASWLLGCHPTLFHLLRIYTYYLPRKLYSQNDVVGASIPESKTAMWIMSPLNPSHFVLTENAINLATAIIIKCIKLTAL